MAHIVTAHPVIDDVLSEWGEALGAARPAYRGHVYRVFNVATGMVGSEHWGDELAVASAFHDIGIWSDRTFDYLAPSAARAEAYVRERASPARPELVGALIENHHRLMRVRRGANAEAIEAFRKADLVDVSRGLLGGVDRGFQRELVATFPYAGFHGILVRTAGAWFVKHPLRPLPMVKL
jgi:hypothetical protein